MAISKKIINNKILLDILDGLLCYRENKQSLFKRDFKTLNIKQRFSVVVIYIAIILGIGYYITGNLQFITDSNSKLNAVLKKF